MSKKTTKQKDYSKPLCFFGGLLLCLFSVTLVLNVWYIARFLTYIPGMLFGAGSYLIYLLIYALGMSLFFREKMFKIKSFFTFVGILLLFFGIVFCMTAICSQISNMTVNGDLVENIKKYNDSWNFKTYMGIEDPNGFIYHQDITKPKAFLSKIIMGELDPSGNQQWLESNIYYAGGYVGYSFLAAFAGNQGLMWFVIVVMILLGIFLTFRKFIINFAKKSFPKNKKDSKAQPATVLSVNSGGAVSRSTISPTPINNKNIISDNIDSNPVEKRTPYAVRKTPNSFGTMGLKIGQFSPAAYQGFSNSNNSVYAEPLEEEVEVAEVQERINEQQFLDFDAKPEPSLTSTFSTPVFIEPVSVKKAEPIVSQPIQTQQPTAVKKEIKWIPPSSDMLEVLDVGGVRDKNIEIAEERKAIINQAFSEFKVGAKVSNYVVGPSVTRFNIEYDVGVSSRSAEKFVDDIAIRLEGVAARFESIIEGQSTSGLEIPNAEVTSVSFKEVFEALPDVEKHPLAIAFGKNIQGKVIWSDFNEFPHCLVAGTTGSGKSVFINSVITSLIMRNSPNDLRIILVDPKTVEMSKYKDIPHLLCPVINEPEQAKAVMNKLVEEMNDRYALFEASDSCTSLKEYNEWCAEHGKNKMPYIIAVLDEYGDLYDNCKEISQPVNLIGQKARAAGIHMMICTQRPSTNIITGTIKANLPTHIALMCGSYTDSMTILGQGGAEKLVGKGDMLVQSPIVSRVGVVRLQSCYIQRKEMLNVIGYLKSHYTVQYDEKFLNIQEKSAQAGQAAAVNIGEIDPSSFSPEAEVKYQSIKEWVVTQQFMSISKLVRECSIGFSRAGHFFLRLQNEGIVSKETEGNRGCKVIQGYIDNDSLPTSDEL